MIEDLHVCRKLITSLMSTVMGLLNLMMLQEFMTHHATQKSKLDIRLRETSSWSSCLSGILKKKMELSLLMSSANTTVTSAPVLKPMKNSRR